MGRIKHTIKSYLTYYFKAKNSKNISSPYLSSFVQAILEQKEKVPVFSQIVIFFSLFALFLQLLEVTNEACLVKTKLIEL